MLSLARWIAYLNHVLVPLNQPHANTVSELDQCNLIWRGSLELLVRLVVWIRISRSHIVTYCKRRDCVPYNVLLLTSNLSALLEIISFDISDELSLTSDWIDLEIIHGSDAVSAILVQH